MGRFLVEKVIVPALEALRDPKRANLAWVDASHRAGVAVWPRRGDHREPGDTTHQVTTRNPSNGVFAKANPNTPVVQPGPKPLNPVDHGQSTCRKLNQKRQSKTNFAKAKPTTPVVEPGPKHPKPVQPLSEFKLQEEPKPAKSR